MSKEQSTATYSPRYFILDTFKKANAFSIRAQETSNLETESEEEGPSKKRKRKPNKRYESDDASDGDGELTVAILELRYMSGTIWYFWSFIWYF